MYLSAISNHTILGKPYDSFDTQGAQRKLNAAILAGTYQPVLLDTFWEGECVFGTQTL